MLVWIGQCLALMVIMNPGLEATMRRLILFAATISVVVCAQLAVAVAAGDDAGKAPVTVAARIQPAYSAAVRPPGRRLESVLTNPRGAVADTTGSRWLLHSGTEHDTCERADVTSGLRMVCLAW